MSQTLTDWTLKLEIRGDGCIDKQPLRTSKIILGQGGVSQMTLIIPAEIAMRWIEIMQYQLDHPSSSLNSGCVELNYMIKHIETSIGDE